MKAKHTAGPWAAHGENIRAFPPGSEFADPHIIAVARKSVYLADKSPKIKEWEANAHLIAAAPDLLKALENLIDFAETLAADGGRSADLREAYAAIAKATGGEE